MPQLTHSHLITIMFLALQRAALLLFAPVIAAQTVGVPNVNDIQVAMPPSLSVPAGSGATSCFNAGLHSPVNAGLLDYLVIGRPTAVASLLFLSFCGPCGGTSTINLGSTVPVFCGGGNAGACLGGPANANLCWALNIAAGCSVNAFMGPAGAFGHFQLRIPIPALVAFGGTLWAQAVIVDPCSTGGFHMTPAIGID